MLPYGTKAPYKVLIQTVLIVVLSSPQKHMLWVFISVNEYPIICFGGEIRKNIHLIPHLPRNLHTANTIIFTWDLSCLTAITTLWAKSVDDKLIVFLIFLRKQDLTCQNLFSGKSKKNILICCLLKILPGVLSVKWSSISHWRLSLPISGTICTFKIIRELRGLKMKQINILVAAGLRGKRSYCQWHGRINCLWQ